MTDQDVSTTSPELGEEPSPEEALKSKLKEAIVVAVEDIGPLRKKVTITVPRDAIDEQLHSQYDELRHEADVPGFRRGRAPQKLLEKRFGREVGEKVGSSLVGASYLAAIDKEGLDVLGDPLVFATVSEPRPDEHDRKKTVEVEKLLPVDKALDHLKLPKEGDFSFACEVEIKPTFELPSLEKIPVERPKLSISDDDVDREIRRMMMLRGTYRPVPDGSVEPDDMVVGNAKVIVDGEPFKTEENAELAARDQRYEGLLLAGFGKAVQGRKAGDTISLEVDVPDDHGEVQIRGKQATFELALLDVKRLEVPEPNDEFVQQLGFENLAEFREYLRDRLQRRLTSDLKEHMHGQISRYLLDETTMDVPEKTSQRQASHIVARQMMELYRRGVAESEIAKRSDEMQTKASAQAVEDLKHFFIMEKIATDREVDVSEEELNTAIAEIAVRRNQRFDRVRDEIISSNQLNTLYIHLRDEKILEILLADAEVTDKELGAAQDATLDAPQPEKTTNAKEEPA